MIRGGSWNNNPWNCRSANRNNNNADNRNNNIGFRVLAARRLRWKTQPAEQDRVPFRHSGGQNSASPAWLVRIEVDAHAERPAGLFYKNCLEISSTEQPAQLS